MAVIRRAVRHRVFPAGFSRPGSLDRPDRHDRLGPALKMLRCAGVLVWFSLVAWSAPSQTERHPLDPALPSHPASAGRRIRLVLKDGSYQTVLSYTISSTVVRYRSAERNGEVEEIPLAMVDLPATQAWGQAHDPALASPGVPQAPEVLSPELAREEALQAARTPEVAKDLRLPEEISVLALDTFHGTPELVPLPQFGSDLNHETAHAVSKKDINRSASPHDLLLLKDERADVQLHVPDPSFFIRLENAGRSEQDGGGLVVDTHGQAGRVVPEGGSAQSTYVLEHVDVRKGARSLESLQLRLLNTGAVQPDVFELRTEILAGGVWEKLTPRQPLEFGEYILVEVLDGRAINADVWDFGVHPTAKENDEALRPEPKRPVELERRRH